MSLIVTQVSPAGIIFATDTHLSSASGPVRLGPKTIAVPRQRGAVAVCGSYSQNGQCITDVIKSAVHSDTSSSIEEFTQSLLDLVALSAFRGVILHVAGFGPIGGTQSGPSHFHISDLGLDPVSGSYTSKSNGYEMADDLSRYTENGAISFPADQPIWFTNGYPEGRSAYVDLLIRMVKFRNQIFQGQTFVRPHSIEIEAEYLRLDMQQIGLLFLCSTLPAYIGGPIDVLYFSTPSA